MGISRRILFATFGSLGDLHPYLAVAVALRRRGHRPLIATHASHADWVRAEGVDFHAVRPDPADHADDAAVMRRAWRPIAGPAFLVRDLVLAGLADSFADLDAAADGVDLVVSHPLTFAAPLVAQRRGLPWVSTVLAPAGFLSAHDPPAMPLAPGLLPALGRVPAVGTIAVRAMLGGLRRAVRPWGEPVRALRRRLGLPAVDGDVLIDGQFSPHLTLAMFPALLGSPQPDWPANVQITGFAFYDGGQARDTAGAMAGGAADGTGGMVDGEAAEALRRFLPAGEPPLVFTLGSAAVFDAGGFYRDSATAAARLGRRAVLLIGADPRNRPVEPLPPGVIAVDYAPHGELFAQAEAIVHQGGIGTAAQVMRAGRVSLVVPFGFDQPDNARRLARLGVARVLPRRRYDAARATRELARLLDDPHARQQAAQVACQLAGEDGAQAACLALERILPAQAPFQRDKESE